MENWRIYKWRKNPRRKQLFINMDFVFWEKIKNKQAIVCLNFFNILMMIEIKTLTTNREKKKK